MKILELSGAIGNNGVNQMQLITKDLEQFNGILRQNENFRGNFLFNWKINLSSGILRWILNQIQLISGEFEQFNANLTQNEIFKLISKYFKKYFQLFSIFPTISSGLFSLIQKFA